MGKKLIIKGADFSAVAVDSLFTLDSIAWDGKTYRDIFETNNLLGISPGFENGSYAPLTVNAGNPEVVNTIADSGQYSLKVFGATSQQLKDSRDTLLTTYLLAARVSCTRYTAGKIGVLIGSDGAVATDETNGFVTFVNAIENSSTNKALFVGSASSADLDGYIDTPVVVISTYFTNVPTIEQFTQLYNQYVAIKKGA